MADDLKNYKGAIEAQVSKDALTGKYTVNYSLYSAGTKTSDGTYEYTPEGNTEPTTEPEEPVTNPEEPIEDGE